MIFLIACTPQQIQETQETKIKTQQEETIEVTPPEFYQLKLQETTYLNGIPITLIDLKPKYATIQVDNIKRTFYETQRPMLIKNLEITLLEIYYSGSNFGANKAIVTIEPINLKINQYLIYSNKEIKIKNTPVILLDVRKDNAIIMAVKGKSTKKIKHNATETLENLRIRNIKSFYSDSPSKEAAIIEIR